MGYLYRFAYIQSFLLKKREQITLLLFFWAQEHNTKREKKQPKNFSSASSYLRPKFLEFSFALKKTPKSFPLDTYFTRQRKRKKWSRLPKVRALCSFPAALFLSFSLSFVPMLRFLRVRILSLSPFALRLCVRLCARGCVSSGLIFVSEFCFHLNHKFSSRALSRTDFVSSLYHLASSFNSVCCIGAGYVGGPTMAMIALKCPHIEVINIFFLS